MSGGLPGRPSFRTVYGGPAIPLDELVTRVAARVPDFDPESERARFAFLYGAPDAAPS
ncbi:hypothetical protein [Amycolatopsis sp. NPDC003676]